MRDVVSPVDLLRWAEALSGVARTGLGFTQSLYERERFEEVLKIASEIRVIASVEATADAVEDAVEELLGVWRGSIGEGVPGYVTPKSAIGAVCGDADRRILLVQRKDSGWWLYPTGWADVGYSPAEVAIKEVEEETGIVAEVVSLLGVMDPFRYGMGRMPFYLTIFLCRAVGGELTAHPLETADVGFFARDQLPSPLAIRPDWLDLAFAAIDGEPITPLFDAPRSPVWREG